MKTYTFKIKVDYDKVVVACHMQLEQFYDSVKLSHLEKLVERYPKAYITASDYSYGADDGEFVSSDYVFSSLAALVRSKNLKDFLLSDDYLGFVDDDSFNMESSNDFQLIAHKFIEAEYVAEHEIDSEVDDGISETVEE